MTPLAEALDKGLAGVVQRVDRDASVIVQFAAGDFAKIVEALNAERAAASAVNEVTPNLPEGDEHVA